MERERSQTQKGLTPHVKCRLKQKKGMEREEGTEEPVGENRGQERGMREEYDQSTLDEHMKMSHDTHCFVPLTYAH